MPRVIRYFDKINESYVGEVVLPEVPLAKLQEIFEIPSENPMYDSFPVYQKQANRIYECTNIKFNTEKYDYFLEYDG